ncbi:MAG: hypothetical protein EBR82_66750 [Caulobacteraceae bacterium]|nr:hypothetical protein [Caulobacteraceae bacterium]
MTAVAKTQDGWRRELDAMAPQWQALFASPQHLERFRRVVATAIASNPDLLVCDRRSLWASATMAAQDGLQPDGREGAMVIYNVKVKGEDDRERWQKHVKWMPMVGGILKKIRAGGQVLDISVRVVREKDQFAYELGDNERIVHRPELEEEPGGLRYVYSIVRMKDGGIYREVMSKAQVDKVRNASKSKDRGPWADWYEEMAQKTVLRKQSKILPMGAELEAMFQREEEAQDLIPASAPVLRLESKTAAKARRDGDWDGLCAQVDDLETEEALDEWWALNEAEINALPNEHWRTSLQDRVELRREAIRERAGHA